MDARLAKREHLEQRCELVSAEARAKHQHAHAVAIEPEGQAPLAIVVDVDPHSVQLDLERPDHQPEARLDRERGGEALNERVEGAAHGVVADVVEREDACRGGELREERRDLVVAGRERARMARCGARAKRRDGLPGVVAPVRAAQSFHHLTPKGVDLGDSAVVCDDVEQPACRCGWCQSHGGTH